MKLELKFRDDEGRRLLHFLREKYGTKQNLPALAKKAIREAAAEGARKYLAEHGLSGLTWPPAQGPIEAVALLLEDK